MSVVSYLDFDDLFCFEFYYHVLIFFSSESYVWRIDFVTHLVISISYENIIILACLAVTYLSRDLLALLNLMHICININKTLKDIDDALHCIRLPNGNLEAGVHIAGTRS